VDELHDVDGPAGLERNRVEVLVGEGHIAVLLVLVALHDVLERDLLAAHRAHPLVLDAAAVLVVQLVEPQALLLRGREHPDRDGDEAERDGAFPHGPGHVGASLEGPWKGTRLYWP